MTGASEESIMLVIFIIRRIVSGSLIPQIKFLFGETRPYPTLVCKKGIVL